MIAGFAAAARRPWPRAGLAVALGALTALAFAPIHLVPALLYRWQRACCARQGVEEPSRLLPLTTREMQIAIMHAQGLLPKTIADRLALSTSTVREVIQNIRARLGIVGRKMTAEDLEHYVAPPPVRAAA